jgi:uncharacterized protein (TIGR02231 family)
MKYLAMGALFLMAVAPLPGAAAAGEIEADSRVDSVMVFPSGAEVTRKAALSLPGGETTVIFRDLPAETVPGSIRVEGQASGTLRLGSVDQRRLFVPQGSSADDDSERRHVEKEIEKLTDQRELLQGKIEGAQAQQTLLKNLANLPNVTSGRESEGSARTDWNQLLGLISAGYSDVYGTIQAARVELRELDRRIADLEKKLSELAPKRVERTEVKVFMQSEGALKANLTLTYQVPSASWRPSYEARLDSGGKGGKASLELVRRGTITQRTGESWENVAIQLSTTRPSSGSTAPELEPLIIDFAEPPKPEPGVGGILGLDDGRQAFDRAGDEKRARRAAGYARPMAAKEAEAAPPVPVAPVTAQAEAAPFQAVFAVPGRADIAATGEAKSVVIGLEGHEPALRIKSVPGKSPVAYLYAKFKRQGETPLLPGAVTLFRDGTFVGRGELPLIAGEEHELGFGADDLVRVKHSIVTEKRGETGIISTMRTDDRNYRISIKNLHKQKMDFTVLDQLPVARDDQIEVARSRGSDPTRKDVDDKRGVLAWEFSLKPGEEKTIDFGYMVRWPPDKEIVYRY